MFAEVSHLVPLVGTKNPFIFHMKYSFIMCLSYKIPIIILFLYKNHPREPEEEGER